MTKYRIELNKKMQENRKSLIQGHKMLCPRCKVEHSVERYNKLKEIEEYQHETTPIYKCPACKWIFALSVTIPQDVYMKLFERFSQAEERVPEKG